MPPGVNWPLRPDRAAKSAQVDGSLERRQPPRPRVLSAEMLPASNFVCEFGECVRPTSPLLGACGNACCLLCSHCLSSAPRRRALCTHAARAQRIPGAAPSATRVAHCACGLPTFACASLLRSCCTQPPSCRLHGGRLPLQPGASVAPAAGWTASVKGRPLTDAVHPAAGATLAPGCSGSRPPWSRQEGGCVQHERSSEAHANVGKPHAQWATRVADGAAPGMRCARAACVHSARRLGAEDKQWEQSKQQALPHAPSRGLVGRTHSPNSHTKFDAGSISALSTRGRGGCRLSRLPSTCALFAARSGRSGQLTPGGMAVFDGVAV